ncbi:MAG: hypothetical protein JF593_09305 [Novosphingobium sp.]|nr:hypothetical protein [Novosphingobium sp.]
MANNFAAGDSESVAPGIDEFQAQAGKMSDVARRKRHSPGQRGRRDLGVRGAGMAPRFLLQGEDSGVGICAIEVEWCDPIGISFDQLCVPGFERRSGNLRIVRLAIGKAPVTAMQSMYAMKAF